MEKHKTHLPVWIHKVKGLDMFLSVHLRPSVCLELLSINHWPDLIHFGLNVIIHWGLSLHSLTINIHVQNQCFIKTTDTSNIDSCNVGSDYAFFPDLTNGHIRWATKDPRAILFNIELKFVIANLIASQIIETLTNWFCRHKNTSSLHIWMVATNNLSVKSSPELKVSKIIFLFCYKT